MEKISRLRHAEQLLKQVFYDWIVCNTFIVDSFKRHLLSNGRAQQDEV